MAKTVVVTGSSRGIGKAIALGFARKGWNIVVNSKTSEKEGRAVAKECETFGVRAIYVKADVSRLDEVEKLAKEAYAAFGKVDALVNNAGVAQSKLFVDCTNDDIQSVLVGNLLCTTNCCLEFLKEMRKTGGVIVNISSFQGQKGASMETLYATAKAGILGLTKSLAAEYGPSGVRVNAILPGFIETDMTACYSKEEKQEFAANTPLGRLGTPKDVAEVALFLASDVSAFVTGASFVVDGGVSL